MFGYGRPTTITHRPKSSLKFKPSLNFPPVINIFQKTKYIIILIGNHLYFFDNSPITLNNSAPVIFESDNGVDMTCE